MKLSTKSKVLKVKDLHCAVIESSCRQKIIPKDFMMKILFLTSVFHSFLKRK